MLGQSHEATSVMAESHSSYVFAELAEAEDGLPIAETDETKAEGWVDFVFLCYEKRATIAPCCRRRQLPWHNHAAFSKFTVYLLADIKNLEVVSHQFQSCRKFWD